jgi:NTE family protein
MNMKDTGLSRYRPKIVYAISGGAAKGLCHIGMLEALEKRGIMPDLIVGTSAGALIAALYCHFGNAAEARGRIEDVLASEEFKTFEDKYLGGSAPLGGQPRPGIRRYFSSLSETIKSKVHLGMSLLTASMVAEKDVLSLFGKLFEGIGFETLKIPFAATATDLSAGVPVIFAGDGEGGEERPSRTIEGPDGLMRAVMASCSIPLIFPAVRIDGHLFADGGIMANLPAREARALLPGQDLLLAGFDVSAPVLQYEKDLSTMELALRLVDLATRSKQAADRQLVDILFQPLEEDYPWSSFAEQRKFIELGSGYMTEDRLAAFEWIYRKKCLENAATDPNPFRRIIARSRIKRLMPKP